MKNNRTSAPSKRGRPPKNDYAPEVLMRELLDAVAEIYREKGEIKATALELSLPPNKVKKLLITGNVLTYPETDQIRELLQQGKTMAEIQNIMGLSYSTLHTYLPYTKVAYKMSESSRNAERIRNYKARKTAVDTLAGMPTDAHLWDCIVAFQNYPFYTISGLPFSYTLKEGRNGEYTKELFIDRRENSKSLAWSSIRMVFRKALEKKGTVFTRPKELADVRGVSYTFSMLWRFGMIVVPDDVAGKLKGNRLGGCVLQEPANIL